VRTDLKYVRAILRLLRPAMGEAAFQRENSQLRKAAQRLAPMRDAAICRSTLHQLKERMDGRKQRETFCAMEGQFTEVGKPTRDAEYDRIMRATLRTLAASQTRLQRCRLKGGSEQAAELGLAKVYRSCRRRMKQAFADDTDANFHRWRTRLKNLYYACQFLAPVWPKRMIPMVERLKRIQGRIGDDHDLAVLRSVLEEAPDRFGGNAAVAPVLHALRKRSRKLRRGCESTAKKVFKKKPGMFLIELERHWEKWRKEALLERWGK
jgi:CHAD domain-containing protein